MFEITQEAQEKIVEAIRNYNKPVIGLRVMVKASSPFQIDYGLSFVAEDGVKENDHVMNYTDFDVYIEKEMLQHIEGAMLDYVDSLQGAGFKFENTPRIPREYQGTLAEKVVKVIDEHINPSIASHGGFVTLVDIKGNDVIVRLGGGCQGCGMADVTLKNGVEAILKEMLPEVENVFDATDHHHGENPYYKPAK
jgi:Fe/S biogenesis protein NfuA